MYKIIFIITLLVLSSQSHANVIWLWKFDTEYGYIVTDGSLSDTTGAASFNIISFQVAGSQFLANIGADYLESQPVQGFLWDGSEPVEFFRSSGTFTNGSNFYLENSSLFYGFHPRPIMSIFDVAVRAGGLQISGLLTLKTDTIFRNRFE